MSKKSLLGFIKALDQLNGANLHHLTGQDASWYKVDENYREELMQVMDFINNFHFVKNPEPINRLLITTPIPEGIRKVFGTDPEEA